MSFNQTKSLKRSRLFFVGARNNHLPKCISMITLNNRTPAPSLISVLMLTLLMQTIGDIFFLIEMMGFGFAIVLSTVLAGQIKIRIQEPTLSRPVKVPLVLPVFMLNMSLAILTLTVYRKPYQSGICILLLLAGIPFYIAGTLWTKPKIIQSKLDAVTVLLQKLMMAVPEETDVVLIKKRNGNVHINSPD